MLGTNVELGDVVTIITFCVVVFVVCVDGLVKVIFTGDMWGGKELAMLCIMLLILGLPLTGTVIVFETGTTAFGTSFRTTGEELEEFVRLRFLGFSSSSEQLTPSLLAVSAGTGRDALCCTAALATAFAVTVKAVWGTSLGISGTNLRPSMDHSEELLGPDILDKRKNAATRVHSCCNLVFHPNIRINSFYVQLLLTVHRLLLSELQHGGALLRC